MFPTALNWVKRRLLGSRPGAAPAGAGGEAAADDGLGDYESPGATRIDVRELTPAQFIALLAQRANAA